MAPATASLSNCFTPLPLPPTVEAASFAVERALSRLVRSTDGSCDGDGDTRCPRSLRRLLLCKGVLSSSDGSALVELGQTKVICSVRGPRPAGASSLSGGGAGDFQEGGILRCEVRFAHGFGVRPETAAAACHSSIDSAHTSGGAGGGPGQTAAVAEDEVELSRQLYDAIVPAVRLEELRKSAVDLYCSVLQADGSVLPACVAAASIALADASIEMDDLITCCGAAAIAEKGKGGGEDREDSLAPLALLADPSEEETTLAVGTVTLAMLPNFREVTMWEMTGRLSQADSTAAIELCRDGCATMHRLMRKCIVEGVTEGMV
uniref:Exoribonuclease phosphorolytic domain-containing protein n=1 Tax=Trieres chinensis TaxID=1514140 RepID=A0A7S2A982_TRICV|mmetsp:Transcript_7909/g.16738  ORF Transcript_7909/g.16738 Transcript_7909/m.16738 type:complete len:320 (+) Transcript_7909:63-1022(+)